VRYSTNEEVRNAHSILVGRLNGRNYSKDINVYIYMRIILKCI